jgi:hypothetical protein
MKLVEKEDVVRLSQADLKRLQTLAQRRRERTQKQKIVFEVNVVCVRSVTEKGRVRSKAHEVCTEDRLPNHLLNDNCRSL